jgi:hypothetical protein
MSFANKKPLRNTEPHYNCGGLKGAVTIIQKYFSLVKQNFFKKLLDNHFFIIIFRYDEGLKPLKTADGLTDI